MLKYLLYYPIGQLSGFLFPLDRRQVPSFYHVNLSFRTFSYLPGDLLSIKELAARLEATVMKMSKKILAIKESRDPENPRCFIDMYLTKMEEEQKQNPNTTFTGKWCHGFRHYVSVAVLISKDIRLFVLFGNRLDTATDPRFSRVGTNHKGGDGDLISLHTRSV